jgi:hypothetical protein
MNVNADIEATFPDSWKPVDMWALAEFKGIEGPEHYRLGRLYTDNEGNQKSIWLQHSFTEMGAAAEVKMLLEKSQRKEVAREVSQQLNCTLKEV